ncbi:diacylglycerol/lipid kinase family protein [Demequina sp.]|uniref:diacylglycerol/lipid kinase family protein n=1 Tax=Demequina sp. TaxID=2050685 RepID=UPI003A88BE48
MVAIILGSIALVLAVFALAIAISVARRVGARDPFALPELWRKALRVGPGSSTVTGPASLDHPARQRIAFVANPTKDGIPELRERALRACAIRYLPEPMWFTTTEDDPGTGQARQAIAHGADVVVAVGGDGTVRAVAEALAGSGVAMGILPMGTGNLLARNLDLPLADPAALMRAVLEGADRPVDVGYLDVERAIPTHGDDGRHLFLVMAGAGIDAEMVAGANPALKKRLGWLAYFFAALEHLGDKRMRATVTIDDGESVTNEMRTVLLANAGRLPGGLQLIPDASISDGALDVATLDARAGIVGWTDLFGTVIAQGAGIKQLEVLQAWRASRIDHARGRDIHITFASPERVQVDGEELGRAIRMRATVEHQALKVRVPSA